MMSPTNGNVLKISTLAITHPIAAKIKIMEIPTSYKQMSTTSGNVLEISTLATTHPTTAKIKVMGISTSYKQMSTTNGNVDASYCSQHLHAKYHPHAFKNFVRYFR